MRPTLIRIFGAILIALVSLGLVIGILSLSMIQGGRRLLPGPSNTDTPASIQTEFGSSDTTGTSENNQANSQTQESSSGGTTGTSDSNRANSQTQESSSGGTTGTPDPDQSNSQTQSPASQITCESPQGWMPIIVASGQTLDKIAGQYKISPESLKKANCLTDNNIKVGIIIFVPAAPVTDQTNPQCGPPAGWYVYTVQSGDTLYGIATASGTTVDQLKYANCLTGNNIFVGQRLYVPNIPPNIVNPGMPLPPLPTPTSICSTISDCLTPQTPMLPTGIPFPIAP
jgi:LysM repeat protein